MVALDFEQTHYSPSFVPKVSHASLVPLGAAGVAALVALVGYAIGQQGGWAYATDLVLRFTTLLFAFAFAFGPAGRLVLGHADHDFAIWSRMVMLGFVAAYVVFLGCVAFPYILSSAPMPFATIGFCFFNAFMIGVLALTSAQRATNTMGDRTVASLHRLCVGFFWVAFSFSDLAHIYGPHRPDAFYGVSLCTLVAALLVRFADTLAVRVRSVMAESTAG